MDEADRFLDWIILKEKLHRIGRVRSFREGEVWWCSIGENVGVEINGKNNDFSRPVLVFRKLNKHSFLAIPLTTQCHDSIWYTKFEFKNKVQFAVLSQIRVMSVSRLNRKMGMLPESDYELVKGNFANLYLKNNP